MNGCVIARSSQPLVGMLSWRSKEDEKLLSAISHACSPLGHRSGDTPLLASTDLTQLVAVVVWVGGWVGGWVVIKCV